MPFRDKFLVKQQREEKKIQQQQIEEEHSGKYGNSGERLLWSEFFLVCARRER
jgi:hypothetical protein